MKAKLSTIFLVVAIVFFLVCVYQGDKKLIEMNAQIESLEQSVRTPQEFVIRTAILTMNNMLYLYTAAGADEQEIKLIEQAIKDRKQLWDVVK